MPEVRFRSTAFNTSETRPHFINEHNYGEDLATAIREKLRELGFPVEEGEIGQEDHGWYFNFGTEKPDHTLMVGHVSDTHDEWLAWVERDAGFVSSLFGGRNRGIQPAAVEAVRQALSSMPALSDIVWE